MGNASAKPGSGGPPAPRGLGAARDPFAAQPPAVVLFDLDQTLVAALGGSVLADPDTYTAHTVAPSFMVLRSPVEGAVAFAVRPRACATLRAAAEVASVGVWSRGTAPYVRLIAEAFVAPAVDGRLRDPDDAEPPRARPARRRSLACVLDRSHCERALGEFGNHKDLRFAAAHLRLPVSSLFLVEDQPDNAPWTQSQRVVWVRPFNPPPALPPDAAEAEAAEMEAVATMLRFATRALR